ncbi:hypothetical protein [Streptomyces sp. WM6349]|uniref:hypothetical protein n=1 Tax=Streptomyces sp. WM6349 TaxID=1415552 RepID=UPI0006AD9BE3|nr:hypothetical protein [Streptomyces sp. WM6349]KOU17058.1 hypothetical protein ADK49_17145 [Streptomyces sp. WM6349]
MPEIAPDLSDTNRCVSVHWNLPVQCVLPAGHRANWHEAWHPQTRNRIQYRRSMGLYQTNELLDGEWRDLEIPPPGGFCNDQRRGHHEVKVLCTERAGHGWSHRAIVDGCTYSWNTPLPKGLNADQLGHDVRQLRGLIVQLAAENAELAAKLAIRDRQVVDLDSRLAERDEQIAGLLADADSDFDERVVPA